MSLLVAALALLVCAGPAPAQFTTASLGGTVLDPAGAAVPGAIVTVMNTDTGYNQSATTSATGAFVFPTLPVGNYRLHVEKSGFSPYTQEGITLTVNQAASQTISLKLGGVSTSVTVSADAELVNTRSAQSGQLVDEKRILDLPLNGRQAQALIYLAPGTVDTTNRYCGYNCFGGVYPGEQQAAVNGTGPGQVNYQLDGAGHNDTFLNMNLPFPNPDAIQEFDLESSNLSAQFGSASGGVVNIVTKSGTNEVHGDLFEFLRNGDFNARNFFAASQDTLKRNQFGGSIGGPIIKNKLFYFGTYQGTRVNTAPGGSIAFVPTQAERQGDFSALLPKVQLKDPVTGAPFANNQVPLDRLSPVAMNYLNYVPLPNGPNGQINYVGPPSVQNDNQYLGKVDYNLGRHQISGRYFDTKFTDSPAMMTTNLLTAKSGSDVHVRNAAINETFTARPNVLFNTWFGYNQQVGGALGASNVNWADLGSNIAMPDGIPPEAYMEIGGAFSTGTGWSGQFNRGDYTLRENVTVIHGAHELHFGAEAVRLNKHFVNSYRMGGFFFFWNAESGDNLADFMLGRASEFIQGGGEFTNLTGTRLSSFAQDNWRVNQKLTLNLGVRWDPFLPYQETDGRVTCFVPGVQSVRYPNAPAGLLVGGANRDPGCPEAGVNSQWAQFAPRVGFAYRLTQDGKTSVRGGIGYYYTAASSDTFTNQTNPPFSPQYFLNDVDMTNPYASAGMINPFPAQFATKLPTSDVPVTRPAGIGLLAPMDLQMPLITTWNLFVEREIFPNWLLRVGYVGNKGTHLGGSDAFQAREELNPAVYMPGQSTFGNTQSRRLYQDFSSISALSSGSNSHYNSLQISVEKRFAHGLSLQTNYTWSKTIDDFGWTDPFYRGFDYGISNDDLAHVFKLTGIYQFPRANVGRFAGRLINGWELTSNVLWHSGFPFSVYSGADNSFSGVGRDRTDFLGGDPTLGSNRPHGNMISQWFNTSLFVPNAVGTFGNSGKNILRGPRFFNTDIGLVKDTRIFERATAQFRAEFFNVFNNVNFGQPVATQNYGASFGQILSANQPRILQFALKLSF